MDDIDAVVTADDLRLLAEIGFSAVSRGEDAIAEAVFAGITAVRPQGEAGAIGKALVHLHRGEAEAAVTLLRRFPGSDAARLFLGLALNRAARRAEAREVLESVAATAQDPAPAEAARSALAEI